MPMPLLAIQLLWLNVVTDGIQDFALSFEKAEDGIMNKKPVNPKSSIFDKNLFIDIIISGLYIGLIVFIVWSFLINHLNMDINIARGYIMALMAFIQNIHVFNCRSENLSITKIPITKNKLILYGVTSSILLQIIIMETPVLSNILKTTSVPFIHMLYLFLISLSILLVMEMTKKIKCKLKFTR